jgi:ABC-2 type transport system permease protein
MRLSFRSRTALIFMFVVPVLVTALFWFMFGRIADGEGFEVAATTVAIVNLDTTPVENLTEGQTDGLSGYDLTGAETTGAVLVELLKGENLASLMQIVEMDDPVAARAAVDRQEAGVALIIPANFGAALMGGPEKAVVELYRDPTLTIGPGIVASVVSRFLDTFSAPTLGMGVTMEQLGSAGAPISGELVDSLVSRYMAGAMETANRDSLRLQPIAGKANPLAEMLSLILGGMMVFYSFYTGANVLQSIVTEQEKGTLQRLFSTPTSHLTIIAGKFLAAVLVLTVQVVTLLVFGRLVFSINWGRPLAVALAASGIVVVAATAGVLLVSLLKTSKQAGVIYGGVLTLTGMLGLISVFTSGMPNSPASLQTISLLVPQGWAIRALRIAADEKPLAEMWLPLAVLLLWSAAFALIGQYRLKRRFA